MIKFIEWLGGFYAGLRGVNFSFGSLNFVDGYSYGYQEGLNDV